MRIRIQAQSEELRRQFEDILKKTANCSLLADQDTDPADLLIIELSDDPDQTFELVQNMLEEGEVGEIFLVSASSFDQNLLLKALRAGAREFFSPETSEDEVRAAMKRFAERHAKLRASSDPVKTSKLFAVMGSKGGVGTTTIAVNMAVSLAQQDSSKSVVLLDMNLFGDIPLFMEIEPTFTWREIIKNISRLDPTFLKSILAKDPLGVYVLPSPGYLDSQSMATPEIIAHLLNIMGQMFDFIVVDVGQLMDDNALKILSLADLLFLVTVQSLPCLANTNKILRSFQDIGFPPQANIRLLINRYLKSATIDVEEVETSLKRKVYWKILNDYQTTISAINKGKPLVRFAPREPIAKSFSDLADDLLASPGDKEKAKKKWWIF